VSRLVNVIALGPRFSEREWSGETPEEWAYILSSNHQATSIRGPQQRSTAGSFGRLSPWARRHFGQGIMTGWLARSNQNGVVLDPEANLVPAMRAGAIRLSVAWRGFPIPKASGRLKAHSES